MNDPLQSVIGRLRGVVRSGDGFMALCPAHADTNPSLSIRKENGKVLLKCFAGCTTEAICAALNLEVRELFDGAVRRPQVVAEYNYVDKEGKLVFQVLRTNPKGFWQRQPDGKGGWIRNLKGVKRVVYRLPEVLQARSVLVCEGEKDCETARKMDLVATCNPGGAGKWRDDYSEVLRSRRVAVIADADTPGRKHAEQVATSLYGKVESLKLLELPGAKDLTDWLNSNNAEGTREDLLEFIRKSPEWKPKKGELMANVPSRQAPVKIVQWEQIPTIAEIPLILIEWLIENIIPRGSFIHFFGEPGHFKTWLAMAIAKAVATGQSFAGQYSKKTEVLYLDRENPACVIRDRANYLGLLDVPLKYWSLSAEEEPPPTSDPRLLAFAAEHKPLIIFDALVRFHRGDENKSNEMKPIMENLRALVSEGATVLCLHHRSGKSDSSYRGSSEILAACDLAYEIRRRETGGTIVDVRCLKNRFELERQFAFELTSGGFVTVPTEDEAENGDNVQILAGIIKSRHPINQQEIVAEAQDRGIGKQQCMDLLKENPSKLWRYEKGPKNSNVYHPFEPAESEPDEVVVNWRVETI